MNYILKVIVFFSLAALSLFLQSFNFFKVGSINPNFILIFFSSLVVFYDRNKFFSMGLPILLGIIAWSFFFIPFWIESILIIGIISGVISLFNLNFTGNKLLDILIVVLALTLSFYLITWILQIQKPGWFIAGEFLYSGLISIPFYFIVKKLKYATS